MKALVSLHLEIVLPHGRLVDDPLEALHGLPPRVQLLGQLLLHYVRVHPEIEGQSLAELYTPDLTVA